MKIKKPGADPRECVPNIDGLSRMEQARVLTLIRTAQAHGVNEDYYKGLARMSAVYGFGVVFEDIDVSGFYSRKHGMVVINPNNLDETYGHEIKHTFDQVIKEGKAEFRSDLSEKVRKIVGASVFDKAKAQYKADYDKLRARDGSVAEMSDAELDAEASANVVGKYLSNMTLLKKIAATDYSLGRGLLAAIRRMKDKWTSAKAFAKENDSTAFAEYRKMTRIEKLLVKELNMAKNQKQNGYGMSYSVSDLHNEGKLRRYNEELSRIITSKGDSIIYDENGIIDFVDKTFGKNAEQKYAYFGIVPDSQIRAIEKKIKNMPKNKNGVLFKKGNGYSLACSMDSIRHLLDDKHLSYEEIVDYLKKMPETVLNSDSATYDVYLHDGGEEDGILFKKEFPDGTIASFQIISNAKNRLRLQSLYMDKGDYQQKKKSATPLLSPKAQADTSKTGRSQTSNDRVSQSPAVVNPSGENISYSPAGDTSSASFKRWFGNSPFKNEDGTPKVYYHGAKKGGGFTVFRDWQYFTDKKQYAERYAERGNPNALYEVYLTADKVFDTRNADARKIFQSIRNEYGLSELQDTGLPDWTDGYDITEYLSEHPELGYDAVILDEGGDLVDGEPVSRGESIIIKSSAQVKSATDNIGTYDRANPDISYSPAPVTPETDSRYLELARDPQKNESELRRLVKEAAEKAGFNSPLLYHGTDYYGKITVFRKGKTGYLGGGIYFTDSETNAKRYAEKMGEGTVYSAYLQVKNPLRVSSADPAKEILFAAYGSDRAYNARVQNQGNAAYLVEPRDIKKLQSLGYDGIVWKLAKGTETEYSVFDPSQVKSADPVTYDDSGNVIPLSERFNPQNDDIRYSPASPNTSGRVVTQAKPARQTITEKITNAKGQLNRQGLRNALKEGGSILEGVKIVAVNAQQAVENQLVRMGMSKREAAAVVQYARTGRSHAGNAVQFKLADMNGEIRSEGLLKIIEPFLAKKGEVYDAVDQKTGEKVLSTIRFFNSEPLIKRTYV